MLYFNLVHLHLAVHIKCENGKVKEMFMTSAGLIRLRISFVKAIMLLKKGNTTF